MNRVALHSVPRSGSTWLGSLLDSSAKVAYRYQPLFSYGHKDALNTQSTKEEIKQFFDAILETEDEFVLQKESIEQGKVPAFEKGEISTIVYKEVRYHHLLEHLMTTDQELLVLGLIRNPIEVLTSWYNAPREFRRDLGWTINDEWNYARGKNDNKPENFFGYKKWKETALLFHSLSKRFHNRFTLVEYKQLVDDPLRIVSDIYQKLNLAVEEQTLQFIRQSTSGKESDTYSVFKGASARNNMEQLPKDIISFIQKDLKGSTLEKYLK